jgi:hypothetical protein
LNGWYGENGDNNDESILGTDAGGQTYASSRNARGDLNGGLYPDDDSMSSPRRSSEASRQEEYDGIQQDVERLSDTGFDDEERETDHNDSRDADAFEGTTAAAGSFPIVRLNNSVLDSSMELHENEARILGNGDTILDKFIGNERDISSPESLYHPFKNFEDWQFSSAVDRLNVSISKMKTLLSCEVVSHPQILRL